MYGPVVWRKSIAQTYLRVYKRTENEDAAKDTDVCACTGLSSRSCIPRLSATVATLHATAALAWHLCAFRHFSFVPTFVRSFYFALAPFTFLSASLNCKQHFRPKCVNVATTLLHFIDAPPLCFAASTAACNCNSLFFFVVGVDNYVCLLLLLLSHFVVVQKKFCNCVFQQTLLGSLLLWQLHRCRVSHPHQRGSLTVQPLEELCNEVVRLWTKFAYEVSISACIWTIWKFKCNFWAKKMWFLYFLFLFLKALKVFLIN